MLAIFRHFRYSSDMFQGFSQRDARMPLGRSSGSRLLCAQEGHRGVAVRDDGRLHADLLGHPRQSGPAKGTETKFYAFHHYDDYDYYYYYYY